MKGHIGLVGGIGPAAQDAYTRTLIRLAREREHELEMTIGVADTGELVGNLAASAHERQADIFARIADRLAAAGAALIAVTSVAGHFCRAEFATRSVLPVVDLVEGVKAHVEERGYERIGLLGTETIMRSAFYGELEAARIVLPHENELLRVHEAYVAMAVAGTVTDRQRNIFEAAARRMLEIEGCETVLLGGTDLALVFGSEDWAPHVTDCVEIHSRSILSSASDQTP